MPSVSGVPDDLTQLSVLTEDTLLDALQKRYMKDDIYTYIGDILLAVNPFKPMTCYTKEISELYTDNPEQNKVPHIFAVADDAYQSMIRTKDNQCCVISGESGAGKTESTKHVVRHILDLCKGKGALEKKIMDINPLLEAFGNAQTIMNNNSSRFGKFIDLVFDDHNTIIGASLSQYLLEKSRVVRHGPGEKNFHIFYLLFSGLGTPELKAFGLDAGMSAFEYLVNADGEVAKTNKKEDADWFVEMMRCFDTVGFSGIEQEDILNTLCAILHVGNVQFNDNGNDSVSVKNKAAVQKAAELLQVDAGALERALITKTSSAGTEKITKSYKIAEAIEARDAMSKAIYAKMFVGIVAKTNELLLEAAVGITQQGTSIGILDIFGFENFKRNSFEQLCINVANENLQHYFNQYIFTWEQEEYEREGINWKAIDFIDNSKCIDLLLSKLGLLSLCDEESHFPSATDKSMVDKMKANHKDNVLFAVPPGQTTQFVVSHYAGKVIYDAVGFLEKNRDSLADSLVAMILTTKRRFIVSVFTEKEDPTAKRGMKKTDSSTVAATFKGSLRDLMMKIYAATPHFVRCVKPNKGKASYLFEKDFVLPQLRYCGVMETIRIRRDGLPVRLVFQDFINRYKMLAFKCNEAVQGTSANCAKVFAKTGLGKGHAMGKTKVFMKLHHRDELEALYYKFDGAATKIQTMVRGKLARLKLQRLLAAKRAAERKGQERINYKEFDQQEEIYMSTTKKKAAELSSSAGRDEIEDQINSKHVWFDLTMSRRQAEVSLKKKQPGTFLVRLSQSRDGYSLSFVLDNGSITHYSMSKRNGRYRIDGEYERFNTLYQLIEFHKIVPVAQTGVCLTIPPWDKKNADKEPDDMDKIEPIIASLRDVIGPDAPDKQLISIIRAAEYDMVKSLKFYFASGGEANVADF